MALLFLIFLLKIWAQSKARVRLLRWPNVLRGVKIERLLGCGGGVGGVCAWVLRNGMGGGKPAACMMC